MSVRPNQLKFDERGLIPAIAQDRLTGEVRMVAWMTSESLTQTLQTGKATFFSRSRGRLWVKGEESGNVLRVTEVLADCDGDTLLVLCEPQGPSCHTGRDNCFFQPVTLAEADATPDACGKPLIDRLEQVLESRRTSTSEKSYTRSLFDGGADKMGKKIIEEAGEIVDALKEETDERVQSEAADVFFHVLVGLRSRGIGFRSVLQVLQERFGTSGHVEKASRAADDHG